MDETTNALDEGFGLVATFEGGKLAEALACLRANGVAGEHVTVLAKDTPAGLEPPAEGGWRAVGHETIEGLAQHLGETAADEIMGALIGGYAGLWGGLALLAVPGFGPVVLAGGAAALIAETLATSVAGMGLGAVLGAVLTERYVDQHLERYTAVLARGGTILALRGTREEYERAAGCLKGCGPTHLDHFVGWSGGREASAAEGPPTPSPT